MDSAYFKKPKKNLGFHSSWTDTNDNPTQKLSISLRRAVWLKKVPFRFTLLEGERLDDFVLLKSKDGPVEGLSCGAGSSLTQTDSRVLKLKRNGYKYRGFIKEYFLDGDLHFNGKTAYEATYFEHAGLYPLDDAMREIRICRELERKGFLIPQKPVSLYRLELGYQNEYGMLISDISSDFRCDELTIMTLLSFFRNMIKNKRMDIDIDNEAVLFENLNISKTIKRLAVSPEMNMLKTVFHNIGALYGEMHRAGYVRGVGNAWYGNEIICADARIGLCDFDATFGEKDVMDTILFQHLKDNDINLFTTGLYGSLGAFSSCIFDIAANILIMAFRDGYVIRKERHLEPADVFQVLENFFEIRERIYLSAQQHLF
ncbi:hypothetical protein H0O02_02680 [Candidatus Micrarchaeota archaeon]|nr:hypothetical protein [Candidatus Micrarchaeota archaeon]